MILTYITTSHESTNLRTIKNYCTPKSSTAESGNFYHCYKDIRFLSWYKMLTFAVEDFHIIITSCTVLLQSACHQYVYVP